MVGWQCDTSLQINMKAEADGQMGRQDPTADTGVYSLCVCVCVCVCVCLMVLIHSLQRPIRCHKVLCDAQQCGIHTHTQKQWWMHPSTDTSRPALCNLVFVRSLITGHLRTSFTTAVLHTAH